MGKIADNVSEAVDDPTKDILKQLMQQRRDLLIEQPEIKKSVQYIFIDLKNDQYGSDASRIIEITFNDAMIENAFFEHVKFIGAVFFLALAIGILAAILLSRYLSKPIQAIVSDINRISDGGLDWKISTTNVTDFCALEQSINHMVESIEQRRARPRQIAANFLKSTELPDSTFERGHALAELENADPLAKTVPERTEAPKPLLLAEMVTEALILVQQSDMPEVPASAPPAPPAQAAPPVPPAPVPKPKSDTALTKRAPLPSFAAQPLPLPLPAAEDAPKAEPVVPVMQPELVTAEQALEQAVEYVVVPAGPAPGTAQPTAEQTAGSEHGQKTVLFIEDDPVVLKVYGKRLNDEGFVVKSAEDGLVGLDILPQLRPDLVVLDLMLPKLHGLEVLKFMRADVNLKGTPVIVLSNAYMEGLAAKAIEAGANKGLLKTQCTPTALCEHIRP